jgi:hypothetical protein
MRSPRLVPFVLALACVVCFQDAALASQGRALTVSELSVVFESGGDTPGWDEFDIPEFVAAVYGGRAREAIVRILSQPSAPENYHLQVDALTTAQYGRVGVPANLLMEYASGARGGSVGGVLRHRAIRALSMRPDPSLMDFWLHVSKDPGPSFRQLAAAGLSCALGQDALPHLDALRADSSADVARVADFYSREHKSKGTAALACGGRVSRALAATFPAHLRPELQRRGALIRQRIP